MNNKLWINIFKLKTAIPSRKPFYRATECVLAECLVHLYSGSLGGFTQRRCCSHELSVMWLNGHIIMHGEIFFVLQPDLHIFEIRTEEQQVIDFNFRNIDPFWQIRTVFLFYLSIYFKALLSFGPWLMRFLLSWQSFRSAFTETETVFFVGFYLTNSQFSQFKCKCT